MPTTIQLDDPKQFDGEPYEVALRAGDQAAAILSAAVEAIEGLRWAARGAYQTGEFTWQNVLPTPEEFDASPQGRRFAALRRDLDAVIDEAKVLTLAAGWNPKTPLTGPA